MKEEWKNLKTCFIIANLTESMWSFGDISFVECSTYTWSVIIKLLHNGLLLLLYETHSKISTHTRNLEQCKKIRVFSIFHHYMSSIFGFMFHHCKVLTKYRILNLTMTLRLTGEVEKGLIPEIFSINVKEKISNVSEDSLRHTFTIY